MPPMGHHRRVTAHRPTTTTLRSADGLDLVVDHYPGPDDRPPVLLVHGLGSDSHTNWLQAGWVRALRAGGRAIVAPDLRGHGRSGHPHDPSAYTVPAMVGDLRLVLAEIGAVGFDGVGYSLGARLLMTLAGDGAPLRRLVIGGSAGQPQLQGLDLRAIDLAVAGGPFPADPESARVARVATSLPSSDHRALAALIRGLAVDPATARPSPPPQMPTLVAVGDRDQLHDQARIWAARLPEATFLTIPGRTHVSACLLYTSPSPRD